ncbi:MAG: LTA synthase family protein, partial [Crocinitomicaceae bacterium]
FQQLKEFDSFQLIFYCISVCLSFSYFIFIFLLLRSILHKRWLFYIIYFLIGPLWLFSFFGSFQFESMNGIFPNYHTFLFIREEPYSAWILATYTLNLSVSLILLAVIIGIGFLLRKFIQSSIPLISNRKLLVYSVVQLIAFEIVSVFQPKFDQCAIADVNFAMNIQRAVFDFSDYSRPGGGLKEREIPNIEPTLTPKNFNVLVVIFESARKRSMGLYNKELSTTPFLNEFEKKYASNFYKFLEPKTIATSTMLAVPAILNGIGPYQDKSIMFSQPLIWEYAKALNYKTFFMSSHQLSMFAFDDFYDQTSLDFYYHQENSGNPLFNDLGMDDKFATEQLTKKLSEYKDDRFFGVIQYNTTHYPYTVPEEFMKWGDETIMDEYYNAMYYQDQLLSRVISQMEKEKLMSNTIILFVSDHSEAIDEHKNIGHLQTNYIETLDIPMMLYVPDGTLKNEELNSIKLNLGNLTSNIDVTPTIFDLLDLEKNEKFTSYSKNFTGYSLLQPVPENRYVITFNSNSYANFNTGISILNQKWHYLYRTNIVPNREELYFWKSDPLEAQDYLFMMPSNIRKDIAHEFEKYPESARFGPLVRKGINRKK